MKPLVKAGGRGAEQKVHSRTEGLGTFRCCAAAMNNKSNMNKQRILLLIKGTYELLY